MEGAREGASAGHWGNSYLTNFPPKKIIPHQLLFAEGQRAEPRGLRAPPLSGSGFGGRPPPRFGPGPESSRESPDGAVVLDLNQPWNLVGKISWVGALTVNSLRDLHKTGKKFPALKELQGQWRTCLFFFIFFSLSLKIW